MKATLCTVGLLGFLSSTFAQGTISFANNSSSLIWMDDYYRRSTYPMEGLVEVLWAPAGTPPIDPHFIIYGWQAFPPGWQEFTPSLTPVEGGLFNTGALSIPTTSPGQPIEVALAAWSWNYPDLKNAYENWSWGWTQPNAVALGISSVFTVTLGDLGNPASLPIGGGPGEFNRLTAIQVASFIPEPSPVILAGVIAVTLALSRRRA